MLAAGSEKPAIQREGMVKVMKKKIISLILLCTLVFSTTLWGCGSSKDTAADSADTSKEASDETETTDGKGGKTKITVLRPGDQEKVEAFMEPAIEQFEKDNPDIDVEIMYESWAGWIQKYPTSFEAGTQPDVIFWWDNKMNDSSAHEHLVKLDDYLSEDFFSQIPDSVWNLVNTSGLDGTYYVPSSVDTAVLYYNKEVFEAAGLDPEAPPATWDELLAAAKAIKEKAGVPGIGVPAITGSEVLEEFVGMFINQATDAPILDNKSMPLFDTDEGLEAVKFVEQLVPYVQDSPTEYGRGELRPLLRDGGVGMLIDGPWGVAAYTAASGENLDESKIGIAKIPLAPNGKEIAWAGTNGWIATRDETAEASAKLIEYLMSPEVIIEHHLAYGSAPLYESEFDNPSFQYDFWKVFYDEAQDYKLYGMIGKDSATPAAYYTALEEVWQQLILGQLSAEDALKAAAEAAEGVTSRNQ